MAYYSNEGTPIHAGAAGLGVDMGPLSTFRDGSLGVDPGQLSAFRDGSLGVDPGQLSAFRDGSLGSPLFLQTEQGTRQLPFPATIYHGRKPMSGVGGCGCSRAVGEDASGAVLDMSNPATVLEVKKLMLLSGGTFPAFNAETVPEDFATNPQWDQQAAEVASLWISAVLPNLPGTNPADLFVAPENYPSPAGISAMLTLIGYPNLENPPTTPQGPSTRAQLPIVTSFADAAGPGGSQGSVLPPAVGAADKAKLAMIGLGVITIVGVAAVLMMGKKRRR